MSNNFIDTKKHVNRQGTKILHDIAQAYERGAFDDPDAAVLFCGLLACICEGKVKGIMDEETATVQWSLTPEYSTKLDELYKEAIESMQDSPNVVRGPW